MGIIGLQGRLVDRTFDTKVFLSLNQVWVQDHYQKWGDQFSFLARSSSDPDDNEDLIKTCYTIHNKVFYIFNHCILFSGTEQFHKNSPYYSGVDQFLDFYFNTLDLACNRETIVQLRDMWNSLQYVFHFLFFFFFIHEIVTHLIFLSVATYHKQPIVEMPSASSLTLANIKVLLPFYV